MKKTLIAVVVILVLLGGVGIVVLTTRNAAETIIPATVQAQQASSNSMQTMLERLKARMQSDPAYIVNFQFINPPIPGEPAWDIPAVLTEPGSTRTLGDIGSDYVCFIELGQSFNNSVCIPFSNVKMVIYPNT